MVCYCSMIVGHSILPSDTWSNENELIHPWQSIASKTGVYLPFFILLASTKGPRLLRCLRTAQSIMQRIHTGPNLLSSWSLTPHESQNQPFCPTFVYAWNVCGWARRSGYNVRTHPLCSCVGRPRLIMVLNSVCKFCNYWVQIQGLKLVSSPPMFVWKWWYPD